MPKNLQLTDTERQLKALLENTNQSFILLDKDYNIVMFNVKADRGMRYFYDQPLKKGESYWDYVGEDKNAGFKRHFKRALEGKGSTTEKKLSGPKGSEIWIETNYTPVYDNEGKVNRVLYSYTNISDRKRAEKTLRESEANLRAIFNSSKQAFFLLNKNTEVLTQNKAAKEHTKFYYGKTLKPGEAFISLLDKEGTKKLKRNMQIALSGGHVTSEQEKETSKGTFYCESEFNVVKDDEGKPYGVTVLVSDITDKKKAELKLKASEQNLRTIFNNSSQTFYLLDKDLRIITFNNAAADMIKLQFDKELKVGDSMKNYIPKNDQSDLDDFQRAFNGEAIVVEKCVRTRGHELWFERHYNYLKNEEDEIDKISVWSLDITERKKAEEDLRNSEEKFRSLTTLAPVGIYQTDPEGNVLYVNHHLLKLLGMTMTEAYNDVWTKNVVPEEREDVQKGWEQKLREEKPFFHEYRIKNEKGEIRHIVETAKPLKDNNGKFIGHLGTITDITTQKENIRLEAKKDLAEKSLKFKSEFLASMSHEIRTPLNGILSMAELLLETDLSRLQKEFVENVFSSSKNLRSIVNDILDLSKLEAGKMTLSPTRFSLKKMVKEIKGTYKVLAEKKGLKLKVYLDDNLPQKVVTDRRRLMQILSNLLRNAIKFTDKGSITLKVDMLKEQDGKHELRFSVEDTGMGIAEKDRDKLFRDYEQIDTGQTKDFEGTGLGLPISKKLTELLSGKIGFESEPGKGSNFWFTIETEKGGKKKHKAEPRRGIRQQFNCKVLLAEDNLINQRAFSLMLKKMGCQVDMVTTGKQALEKAQGSNGYDIIFMDIQMPGMDGITATKKLRERTAKAPPIIGLSGNVFDEMASSKSGMDDYILKPIVSEDLQRMLKKWCGKKVGK